MQVIRNCVSDAAVEAVQVVEPVVKKYKKASKLHETVTEVIFKVNELFASVSKMVYFSKAFHSVSASVGVFCATDLLFAPLRLGKSMKDAICSKTVLERIRAVAQSIEEVSSIGLDVVGVYFTLRAFNVLASSTLSWIGVVAPIFAAVQSIMLPFSMYDLYKLNRMRKAIQAHCKRADESLDLHERLGRAMKGLRFLQKNCSKIEKTASISKKAELKKRVSQLQVKIQGRCKKKALKDTEQLMSQLRTHVRTKTMHDALSLGADVTGIALTVLSTAISSVAPPVLPASAVVMAVAHLGLLAGKYLMLKKNPFDQKQEGLVGRTVEKTREAVQDVSHCAYKAMKFVTVRPVQRLATALY